MKINVLDKGYVSLANVYGNELDIVNAARVSFDKESKRFGDADKKLIAFLLRHGHYSPFRHVFMQFEFYAPLMVARQLWKHVVGISSLEAGSNWNESCLPAWQELWSYGNMKVTVADLLKDKNMPLRSVDKNGVIVPNRVRDIWSAGPQEVLELIDEFGNKLACTANHRIATPDGFVEAGTLKIGDSICHNGMPAYSDKAWLKEMCATHTTKQIAKICDVTDRTIHVYKKKFGLTTRSSNGKLYADKEWLDRHYNQLGLTLPEVAALADTSTHTIRKWAKKFGIQKDNVQVLIDWQKKNGTFVPAQQQAFDRAAKAKAARNSNATYYAGSGAAYRRIVLRDLGLSKCYYCDAPIAEVHHRDRNRANNVAENLMGLCLGHHRLVHGKRPAVYGVSRITSIRSLGMHETYDIEMELEPNFVAGGVIVHNSRRYVTEQEEFYVPNEWRLAAKDKKQGSSGLADEKMQKVMQQRLEMLLQTAEYLYQEALYYGITPEQARLFLPAYGMYVRWRWTASVDAILHVLQLRQKPDAQWETRQYANAMAQMLAKSFPHVYDAIIDM